MFSQVHDLLGTHRYQGCWQVMGTVGPIERHDACLYGMQTVRPILSQWAGSEFERQVNTTIRPVSSASKLKFAGKFKTQ